MRLISNAARISKLCENISWAVPILEELLAPIAFVRARACMHVSISFWRRIPQCLFLLQSVVLIT